jgi:hypothetical protein
METIIRDLKQRSGFRMGISKIFEFSSAMGIIWMVIGSKPLT